jgi:hypothetical protein
LGATTKITAALNAPSWFGEYAKGAKECKRLHYYVCEASILAMQ